MRNNRCVKINLHVFLRAESELQDNRIFFINSLWSSLISTAYSFIYFSVKHGYLHKRRNYVALNTSSMVHSKGFFYQYMMQSQAHLYSSGNKNNISLIAPGITLFFCKNVEFIFRHKKLEYKRMYTECITLESVSYLHSIKKNLTYFVDLILLLSSKLTI